MSILNSAGKRPRTMSEWAAFVDGLSRHQRDQLYPGMHKDLIPATEMIDAGWSGTKGPEVTSGPNQNQSDDAAPTLDTDRLGTLARLSASEMILEAAKFESIAHSYEEQFGKRDPLVTKLRQAGYQNGADLLILSRTCREAARKLNGPLTFQLATVTCPGHSPNACGELNGNIIKVMPDFANFNEGKIRSVFGHEGAHLAGYDHDGGPSDPEKVERAVFGEIARAAVRPPIPTRS